MIRKFYFFFVLIFLSKISAQTTNSHILNSADNTLLKDEVYFCPSETFNLKVNAQATSTGDYTITKDSPSLFPFSAGNIPIKFAPSVANKFSEPIDIGFAFSFYGQTYTKVVAGTNGRLVFTNSAELNNLNDVNQYTDRTFSGITGYNTYTKLNSSDYNKVYKNDKAKELPLAQIFFGYTDLVAGLNSATLYNYKSVTVGAVKGLLISYQNEVRTNGLGGISPTAFTSYVILLEDGRIIVYVLNKTEENYNAILGIQNESATKFKVPSHITTGADYNNGKWRSESDALIFTPSQNLNPKFEWLVDGVLKNSTANSTYQAVNDSEKLEVKISFFDETNTQVGNPETSFSIFKKVKTPVISNSLGNCGMKIRISDNTYDKNLIYTWYRDGTVLVDNNATTSQEIFVHREIFAMGNIYVIAKKPDGTDCNIKSNVLDLNKERFLPFGTGVANFCETTSEPKVVNLYDLFYPNYNSASGVLEYFVDFILDGKVITNPENFVINSNTSLSLQLDVKNLQNGSGCITSGLKLEYVSAPKSLDFIACASVGTYDLKSYFGSKYSAFIVKYEYANGSSAGDGSAVDTSKKVFVKIYPTFARCNTTTEINFITSDKIIVPDVPIQERCAGSKTIIPNWFDLASVRQILDPNNLYDVKFYRKSNNSELSQNGGDGSELSGTNFWSGRMGDYIIYARLYDKTNPTCYGESKDIILRVYIKPKIISSNPIIKTNCIGNPIFNLTQNQADITDAQTSVTLEYYSQNNQLLTNAQVANYDASVFGTSPYIKVIYNVSCSDTVRFNLKYNPKPVSKISQITVCEETTYLSDTFKTQVIDTASQYTFYEKDGVTPLRSSFNLTTLPLTVEFFIKNNSTGCISDLQTVTFQKGANSTLLKTETDYETCDATADFYDGKTTFNLDSKKSDFTSNASATFKYYKDAAHTHEITNPSNYSNETAFNQIIYVKITVPGFCPSDAKINLKVNTASKSTTLQDKYFICFADTLRINAGTENTKWEWSDGQNTQIATFTKAGNYSVKLMNSKGCSYIHNFVISDENQPKIRQINQNEQQIEVIASGNYPIEYSFDGGKTFQTSNIFRNPTAEQYDIQVRSVLAPNTYCLGEMKSIFTINIKNVITPNGDGHNDFWTINNLNKMQNVEIIISDRFGKTVFSNQWNINSDLITSPGNNNTINSEIRWDGKYNGRVLPTGTYWYFVKWFDPSTNKNELRQGWILLKNRN